MKKQHEAKLFIEDYKKEMDGLAISPYIIAERAVFQVFQFDEKYKNLEPDRQYEIKEEIVPKLIARFERHYSQEHGEDFRTGCKHGNKTCGHDPRQFLCTFMIHWTHSLLGGYKL